MSIRPIDLNGMIQNANDVAMVRTNEDIKPELQQANILNEFEEQSVEDTTRVKEQDNTAQDNTNPDEGNGSGYNSLFRGKENKNKKKKTGIEGRVIKKSPHGSFNASI
ncbi:MAG: hypothetical protein IIZ61_00945 [Lachnospiraceae bacterium]|nr:hypothetical protein [Lachnospiraceae bacterium]